MATHHKMIIIGSGLSGCMAVKMFQRWDPMLVDSNITRLEGDPLCGHDAVMRVRDPDIGILLGCDCQKISITKMVSSDHGLTIIPSIRDNNSYSLKTSGTLRNSSLGQLGVQERYLLSFNQINMLKGVRKCSGVVKGFAKDKTLIIDCDGLDVEHSYDVCISTVRLIDMAGWQSNSRADTCALFLRHSSVWVARHHVALTSAVNQTIYYPDSELDTYRATLQGDVLIQESVRDNRSGLNEVAFDFGLDLEYANITEDRCKENRYGKIWCNDDVQRKRLIYSMTQQHSMFLLGRHAIWKPIRADEVLQDLFKIKRMIDVTGSIDSYNQRKEMAK